MIGEISPGFRWDILNYGRLVNNVRVQDARFQELAYAYQDQVLNAGREVEDAIVVVPAIARAGPALGRECHRGRKNCRNHQRTVQPRCSRLHSRLHLSKTTLTEQQDQLAVAQGDIALGLIDVYRALGGGWQIRLGGNTAEPEPHCRRSRWKICRRPKRSRTTSNFNRLHRAVHV